jgi:hypothetical protein
MIQSSTVRLLIISCSKTEEQAAGGPFESGGPGAFAPFAPPKSGPEYGWFISGCEKFQVTLYP